MQISPCLHPIRTWNKTLQRTVMVPCGHCSACRVNKGRSLTLKVNNEFAQYAYKFFITLTYDDDHLPVAHAASFGAFVHPHDVDYEGNCKMVSFDDPMVDKSDLFLCKALKLYKGVPVLSHTDARNFKKRLRYYIFKELGFYEEFFLYTCGEYGAKRFRPHFHFLFGTNERRVSDILKSCVYKAWSDRIDSEEGVYFRPFGKIDFQACIDNGSTNYCAQYLSCTTNLPFILSRTIFRPFHTKSRRLDFERPGREEVGRIFRDLPVESYMQSSSGKLMVSKHSQETLYQVFPFIPRFSSLSSDERCRIYEMYGRFPGLTAQRFSEQILSCIFFQDTRLLPEFCGVLKRLCYEDGKLKDKKTIFNMFVYMYCCSRIVCNNANLLGITVSRYVKQIELYHSKLELRKLKDFYESLVQYMDDPYHPLSLRDSFALYYNTEDDLKNLGYYYNQFGVDKDRPCSLDVIPQQAAYSALCKTIEMNSCKTHKRNDDFANRGLKRMPYVPVVSRNFRKFLSLV